MDVNRVFILFSEKWRNTARVTRAHVLYAAEIPHAPQFSCAKANF